jgi:hypothetical protein
VVAAVIAFSTGPSRSGLSSVHLGFAGLEGGRLQLPPVGGGGVGVGAGVGAGVGVGVGFGVGRITGIARGARGEGLAGVGAVGVSSVMA